VNTLNDSIPTERILVGINPSASIAVSNPGLSLENFGIFTVPSLDRLRNATCVHAADARAIWGLAQGFSDDRRLVIVPPETGRAIIVQGSAHPEFRDILVKGTGPVEKFIANNKLRDASRGFDGFLELSEAERDLVNGEILHLAGMFVTVGIGVVNHHRVQSYPGFTAWIGNYVRGFRFQIRISNLFEMSASARKILIDEAIATIGKQAGRDVRMTYPEYFHYMVETCARNVAIMQAIGFTQDSFHYGQVTLIGELTDFGIGSFRKPRHAFEINTLHPWFRFERQPILMQNILYKTHAVKAEPVPHPLERGSRAVNEQQTLFGAIRSFCPGSALEIESTKPHLHFWKIYEQAYRSFDARRFQISVLSRIDRYFDWEPNRLLAQVPKEKRFAVETKYRESIRKIAEHFENQQETWERRGPTAIHRQILFGEAVRSILPGFHLDFSGEDIGLWRSPRNGAFTSGNPDANPFEDLSWKPYSNAC
jgi:hypothetical protein